MDGTRLGSEYSNEAHIRRKKIEVIGTNKIQNVKKNHYYQLNNPYSLNRNPNIQYYQRNQVSHDNFSNRETLTQTSSQKSAKIIRTNGLTKAQKPNLSSSKVIRNIVHKTNAIKIGPAFSSGLQQQNHIDGNYPSQQQYAAYNKIENNNMKSQYQIKGRLQQQNSLLKQQNIRLKQQMLKIQRNHYQQVKALKQQLDRVFRLVGDLQNKITEQDKEWETFCKQKQRQKLKQTNK